MNRKWNFKSMPTAIWGPSPLFLLLLAVLCLQPIPGHGQSPVHLNNESIDLFQDGNFQDALERLNDAVKQAPHRTMIYNNRGVVKAALRDFYGALSDYNVVIRINNDPHAVLLAYFNRANLKKEQGDYDGAILDYTRVLALDPNHAAALRERADAKTRSAESDMQRYQELKKEDS